MFRRGLTLIELLVAMILFVIVASLVMMVFSNQNRSFKTESDKAEVALMAKGTLDELTHAMRMTGSGLPEGQAGIKAGADSLTFVMNEGGGLDTVKSYRYDKSSKLLGVRVGKVSGFSHLGYALLPVLIPPSAIWENRVLPIVRRFASTGCGDSLVLDAAPLLAIDSIQMLVDAQIYNVDSVLYWKRNDTLFVQRNRRRPAAAFATGVDSWRVLYWNSDLGWQSTVTAMGVGKRIDKMGIRLVTRNQTIDPKLREIDSSSRGYRFSVLETEVALRNTGLINQ